MSTFMATRRNSKGYRLSWLGLLMAALGAVSNGLYFLALPGQELFPWINVILPAAGLLMLLVALRRAFVNPQT
jgi:hypothetical protein